MSLFKRKRPMSAEERRQRIAKAQARDRGVGVRCPRCLVHTPGLKPRKVRMGTGRWMADRALPYGDYAEGDAEDHLAEEYRQSGSTLRQYQCPVCDYAWSAAPRGVTDSPWTPAPVRERGRRRMGGPMSLFRRRRPTTAEGRRQRIEEAPACP
jgi:hypothetical protein